MSTTFSQHNTIICVFIKFQEFFTKSSVNSFDCLYVLISPYLGSVTKNGFDHGIKLFEHFERLKVTKWLLKLFIENIAFCAWQLPSGHPTLLQRCIQVAFERCSLVVPMVYMKVFPTFFFQRCCNVVFRLHSNVAVWLSQWCI